MKIIASSLLFVAVVSTLLLLFSTLRVSGQQTTTAAAAGADATSQWCGQSSGISTYFGATSSGSLLTSSVSSQCSIPQYVAVPDQQYKGQFSFNIKGDFVYTAPGANQGNDVIFVDVFCFNNQGVSAPLCRQTFVAQIAAPFTLAPPSGAATTPAPATGASATCPVVYHFTATSGAILSASLRTAVGQPSCPYGMWFEIGRQPNFGSINLVATGDFSYSAPTQQTWDDFGYTLYCFNDILCKGSAYVLVSGTALPTTVAPSVSGGGGSGSGSGNNNGGGSGGFVNKPFLSCDGSCAADSWKATPDSPPYQWDTNAIRSSDGARVGTVRANYNNGSIVIAIQGKIGNLGQRFPTFEPIPFRSGDTLSAQNVLSRVSATSLGFSADCLARQPAGGMGEEVWHWTSVVNRTGALGPYHATGSSWYQKFGGVHDKCDTFTDACTFAPLLNPNGQQDPAKGGVWSVAVVGCDVTWTGRFSLNALRNMKTKSGASVWSVSDGRTVRTTLYLQAIQPTSWLQPIAGYETDLIAKPLVLTLDPDVSVDLDSAATKLFSIDTQFRTRMDAATGDFAFDLDLRLYPHAVAGAVSSYRADRHVAGFRWIEQKWTTPDPAGCAACTGKDSYCASNPRAPTNSFFSAGQASTCTNPVVVVSKGPAMSPTTCIHNLMYIYNRPGLSAPRDCADTFQNLTLTGVAPGSHASTSFFGFEGTLALQLILDTGVIVTASVRISRFVSMMSVDGRGVTGTTAMCRATEYWPVLDPLGTSLPTSPYFLSTFATTALTTGTYLCETRTRYAGPTSWATVMLDIYGSRDIVVESLSIEFADPRFDERVYFLSRDPLTGANTQKLPAGNKNVWWTKKYPFFNFRDLSSLLDQFNHSTEAIRVPDFQRAPAMDSPEVDFAIAFTPGAIDITTAATLVFSVRNKNPDGSLGGSVVLRTLIHLDKMLADRDVAGAHTAGSSIINAGSSLDQTYVAVAVSGGLIAGVIVVFIIFVSVDTSKPLPTWIPNSHALREVISRASDAVRSPQFGDAAGGAEDQSAAAKKRANIQRVDGVPIPTISV